MTATLALMITLCQLNKECKCGEVRNSRVDPPHLAYMKWGTTHLLKLMNDSFLFILSLFMYRVYIEGNHHSKNGK